MGKFKGVSRKVFLGLLAACLLGVAFVSLRLSGVDFGFFSRFLNGNAQDKTSINVIRATEYSKCGCVAEERDQISEEDVDPYLRGLPLGWEAVGSDSSNVYLHKLIQDFCPLHSGFRLLILSANGHLTVYRGKTRDPRFLESEFKEIRESDLDPITRAKLQKGVIIEGDPETINETLRLYLEGIID